MALANERFSRNDNYFIIVVFKAVVLCLSFDFLSLFVHWVRLVKVLTLELFIVEMETFGAPNTAYFNAGLIKVIATLLTLVESALFFARSV